MLRLPLNVGIRAIDFFPPLAAGAAPDGAGEAAADGTALVVADAMLDAVSGSEAPAAVSAASVAVLVVAGPACAASVMSTSAFVADSVGWRGTGSSLGTKSDSSS